MEVETIVIDPDAPGDRSVQSIVTAATLAFLPAEAREEIGAMPNALNRTDSILYATDAVRRASGADLALLNHSAFGASFGKGPVTVYDLDNFVRYDGQAMVAEVDAGTLTTSLGHANQGDRAALDARSGDYVHARALGAESGRSYRIAVSGWVAGRQSDYLGVEGLDFAPVPDVFIRASVEAALRGEA
jgi:2',3'-cyclic-nucleotide 2'-phosphodiesterase (5'-nucleotidase family)